MGWLMNWKWRRLQKQVASTWLKADNLLYSVHRGSVHMTTPAVYDSLGRIFKGETLYCDMFLSPSSNCIGCPLLADGYCYSDCDAFGKDTIFAKFQKSVSLADLDIDTASELAGKISTRVISFSDCKTLSEVEASTN